MRFYFVKGLTAIELEEKRKIIPKKDKVYQKALIYVVIKTGLDKANFPTECPYSSEQLLNDNWFPENMSFKIN